MLYLEGLTCSPGGSCWWAVPPECSRGAEVPGLVVPGLVVPGLARFGRGHNGTVTLPAFLRVREHEGHF